MMGLLRAEWLKTRRTVLRFLVFVLPLLIGAVLGGYIAARSWLISPSGAFSGFFSGWGALVMPVAIAMVAGQLVHEEEQAGSFGGLLLCAKPRWQLYMSKFVMLVLAVVVATALAVGMFCLVLWLGGFQHGGFDVYAQAAVACILAAVPLAAFHLWLAFAAGLGVSVGVGMGGLLVAALIGGTLLGDKIWPFVPWAWPVRMASAAAIVRTPGIDAAALAFFMERVHLACAVVVFSGILLIAGGLWWFSRWNGRHTSE